MRIYLVTFCFYSLLLYQVYSIIFKYLKERPVLLYYTAAECLRLFVLFFLHTNYLE